jgi:hypothetical protein
MTMWLMRPEAEEDCFFFQLEIDVGTIADA